MHGQWLINQAYNSGIFHAIPWFNACLVPSPHTLSLPISFSTTNSAITLSITASVDNCQLWLERLLGRLLKKKKKKKSQIRYFGWSFGIVSLTLGICTCPPGKDQLRQTSSPSHVTLLGKDQLHVTFLGKTNTKILHPKAWPH